MSAHETATPPPAAGSAPLPCPFCGAPCGTYSIRDGGEWRVECDDDTSHRSAWYRAKADAVAAWNRRAPVAIDAEQAAWIAGIDEGVSRGTSPAVPSAGVVDGATRGRWRMLAGGSRNLATVALDEDAAWLVAVADALDAACDALSATPPAPVPDRAAVASALYDLVSLPSDDLDMDIEPEDGNDGAEYCARWRAVAARIEAVSALVYGDATPPADSEGGA